MGVPQLPLALHYPRDQRLETFIGAPDGALAQLRMAQHAGMSLFGEADMLIDFIAQHVDFMIGNRLPQGGEIGLAPYRG